MAIIKLANAGDAVTWRIKKAETVAGKFGPQVKFENDSGDILFISEETAGRQLGRIPLDIDTCAGETLTFSRTENPKGGAPYWNISVADAVDRAAPSTGKRLPPPSRKPLPFDEESFPAADAVYAVAPQDHYPVRQGNMPNLNAPAPSDNDAPEWVQDTPQPATSDAKRKATIIRSYLDLFGYVKAQPEMQGVEASVVQAVSATLFIHFDKKGLNP